VLRAGFETLLNAEFRPGKAGAKGERGTGGFRVLVKRAWSRCGNHLNAIFDLVKRWQKAARKVSGQRRCKGRKTLNVKFNLAKRWKGAKAARKGLGPWWNVLRAGFETL